MDLNDLRVIWDSQNAVRIYSIDEDALHRQVKNKGRTFDRKILIRDIVECSIGFILGIHFLVQGIRHSLAESGGDFGIYWFLYLTSAACFFVTWFIWSGRAKAKRKEVSFDNTIRGTIEMAIWKTERQIHLLSHVLWWYLLPLGIAVGVTIHNTSNAIPQWIRWLFFLVVFSVVYWLNKRAVAKHLVPQKHSYSRLLKKLLEENGEGNSHASPRK